MAKSLNTMCGVFGQTELNFRKSLTKMYLAEGLQESPIKTGLVEANYNIWTGMNAAVIASDNPSAFQRFMFGLTPFWAKKKMYFFNARSEGKLNKENDVNYQGEKGIFSMPSFRHCIKRKRCLIPVDHFVEGTVKNKLSEPYIIKHQENEPFFLAGIWDEWIDKTTGEILRSFSIITTPAAKLLQKIPHHRSPLILNIEYIPDWLNPNTDLKVIASFLKAGSTKDLIAYPISSEIKKRGNRPELFEYLGDGIVE